MKIESIRIVPYEPYFIEPFKMFGVTQTKLTNDVYCIKDSAGRVGYGEAVLSPVLSKMADRDRRFVAGLIGTDLSDLPAVVAELRSKGSEHYALAFGLDTAFHDLVARASGCPLYGLLGGSRTHEMANYLTVPLCDPDEVVNRLSQDSPQREVIQMKLGGNGLALDEARIDAALRTMAEKQLLLADFNGALSLEEGRSVVSNFSDKRLVWEEPCRLFEENETLAEKAGVPLLADQCISFSRIPRVCETGAFYGVTLKPAKTGSLSAARAFRDTCIEAGVRLRIDGPWCGPIGNAAILQLAVAMPPELLIASTDMSGPLALKPGENAGIRFHESTRISPLDKPGIGFTPVLD